MPLWNFQSLWYDEAQNEVYPFGGEISVLHSSPPDLTVWKFKPVSSGGASNAVWSVNDTEQTAPWSLGITRPLGGAAVSTKDTAFLLGGYSSSHSSPQTSTLTGFVPTPGMVMYHFGNSTWGNFTETPGFSDSGAIEWPGMIKVPFGPNGLIVVFGGETSDLTSYTPGEKERWMTKITLFDPVTLQFYRQTASGDQVPSPRNRFCVAGAGDTSKTPGGNSTGSYDMWVLPVSFTALQIEPANHGLISTILIVEIQFYLWRLRWDLGPWSGTV